MSAEIIDKFRLYAFGKYADTEVTFDLYKKHRKEFADLLLTHPKMQEIGIDKTKLIELLDYLKSLDIINKGYIDNFLMYLQSDYHNISDIHLKTIDQTAKPRKTNRLPAAKFLSGAFVYLLKKRFGASINQIEPISRSVFSVSERIPQRNYMQIAKDPLINNCKVTELCMAVAIFGYMARYNKELNDGYLSNILPSDIRAQRAFKNKFKVPYQEFCNHYGLFFALHVKELEVHLKNVLGEDYCEMPSVMPLLNKDKESICYSELHITILFLLFIKEGLKNPL